MKKPLITEVICGSLVLLFAYTAFSKLADFEDFKRQLSMQIFPPVLVEVLLYLIPGVELLAVILMIVNGSRLLGLILSVLLMVLFTGYISLILSDYYDHIPCSCGGVLNSLGWLAHLWFNLFFLVLSLIGLVFQYQILKGGRMKK
jgi:putative oxidoreductase